MASQILHKLPPIEFCSHAQEDHRIFYQMTPAGVWMPDTIHKPFLKAAVQELKQTAARYQELTSYLFGGYDD